MTPDTIRLLDDIYSAIASGERAAESLLTHQTHSAGYETARYYRDTCAGGLRAYAELRRRLGEGKLHIDWSDSDREPPRECYCSATPHPPCSFCVPG